MVHILGAVLCLTVSLDTLVNLTGASVVAGYALTAIAALFARPTGATRNRPYKMPLRPLPPVLALISLGYIFTKQISLLLWVTPITIGIGLLYWLVVIFPSAAGRGTCVRPQSTRTADSVATGELPGPHAATPAGKPRARSLGIPFGGTPGRWNAITDVPGVEVGYATLIQGDSVRTGVTAIHPRGPAGAADPVAAGFFSLNGNGEMTGVSWIEEAGSFSLPIAITNTHAVGIAHAAIVAWTVKHHSQVGDDWSLPVAAETWDGYLNDVNGHHVTEQVAIDALESAAPGPVEEGSVGGGTGMSCYEFKGGNGTASRLVDYGGATYTVGAFLQANFGSREELTLAGLALGELLADHNPQARHAAAPPGAGSVIAIVATDAPLLPHQCKAMARRVTHGLARTGTTGSHFSGDLFLAFSTGNPGGFSPYHYDPDDDDPASQRYDSLTFIPWSAMNPFFTAVVQAVEEAVANALVANQTMTGRDGHRVPALPRERVAELFRARAGS